MWSQKSALIQTRTSHLKCAVLVVGTCSYQRTSILLSTRVVVIAWRSLSVTWIPIFSPKPWAVRSLSIRVPQGPFSDGRTDGFPQCLQWWRWREISRTTEFRAVFIYSSVQVPISRVYQSSGSFITVDPHKSTAIRSNIIWAQVLRKFKKFRIIFQHFRKYLRNSDKFHQTLTKIQWKCFENG